VLNIRKKLRITGIKEDKADIKNLVKQRLSNPSIDKWLLILNNVDDKAL
jgi:phosphoribosylformylglycinamidine (FGAM) synthase PurS component